MLTILARRIFSEWSAIRERLEIITAAFTIINYRETLFLGGEARKRKLRAKFRCNQLTDDCGTRWMMMMQEGGRVDFTFTRQDRLIQLTFDRGATK